jgi:NAD(P)-dependent dehydrogenase (short-subunit alcohol dehydrogenase family)
MSDSKNIISANGMKGKTAFVTGGGKGIGAGIVKRLADAGYSVVFTYSSSEERDGSKDECC